MTVRLEEPHDSGVKRYYGKYFVECFYGEFQHDEETGQTTLHLEHENPDGSIMIADIDEQCCH